VKVETGRLVLAGNAAFLPTTGCASPKAVWISPSTRSTGSSTANNSRIPPKAKQAVSLETSMKRQMGRIALSVVGYHPEFGRAHWHHRLVAPPQLASVLFHPQEPSASQIRSAGKAPSLQFFPS
jgi:hypothetical protein